MISILLTLSVLVCAIQAVRVRQLLASALWLAGASASTAILLFSMSAYRVAVIELSVGGGLVTVLLVFAITMTGDLPGGESRIVPRPLVWGLAVIPATILGVLVIAPQTGIDRAGNLVAIPTRDLDLLLQVVLIFAGGLTVMGLLPFTKQNAEQTAEFSQESALTTVSAEQEEKEVV